MPGPFEPEPQGTLASVLDWANRTGQPLQNLLAGRGGAAGRQSVDVLGDLLDAGLPFIDAIPKFRRPEDTFHASEAAGINRATDPIKAAAVDAAGDIAASPLTYLTGGTSAAAQGAARGAGLAARLGETAVKVGVPFTRFAKEIPGSARALGALGKGAEKAYEALAPPVVQKAITQGRRALGWTHLTPEQRAVLDKARALGGTEARAGMVMAEDIAKGLTGVERDVMGDVFNNLHFDPGGKAQALITPGRGRSLPELEKGVDDLLALRPDLVGKVDPLKVKEAIRKQYDFAPKQFQSGTKGNVFAPPPAGASTLEAYLPRQLDWAKHGVDEVDALSKPSAIAGRTLKTDQDVLDLLKTSPDVTLMRDAGRSMVQRAEQQGRLIERGALGKFLMDEGQRRGMGPANRTFTLAHDADRKVADSVIEAIGKDSPDFAYRLKEAFNGQGKAGWFGDVLRGANRVFKKSAVMGVVVPKVGSIIRNQLGGLWQVLSTDATRGTIGPASRRAFTNLLGAFDDGFSKVAGRRVGFGSALTKDLALIDEAHRAAGGVGRNVTRYLLSKGRKDLAEAVRHGVTDNFVSGEELLGRMARSAAGKKMVDWWDMPAEVFQGLEARMRLGSYKDQLARGVPAQKAALAIKDSFLDYGKMGTANATLRTLIPFAQFTAQTIPQQAKFLASKPGVAVGLGALPNDEDSPLLPHMSGRVNLPLGKDAQGDAQYLSGFGLPVETLGAVPDTGSVAELGKSLRRDWLGASHPFIKSIYTNVSGRDPYFDSKAGSYATVPGFGEQGAAGRAYNSLAGTGLIQPIDTPLRMLADATDDKRSPGLRALDLLTGANITSVNPSRALSQQLSDFLESNPDVQSVRSLYSKSKDPQTMALVAQLNQLRATLRAQKKEREADALERGDIN